MVVTIKISDKDCIDELKAAGATDMAEYFFPKIGIKPDSVMFYECGDNQMQNLLKGEPCLYYEDKWEKGSK